MDNLTPSQAEQIRQQRLAKFKQMGLPETAGQMAQVTEVVGTAANQGVYKTLQDIKKGAKKQFYKEFVQATEGKTAAGYQIPEPKIKKSPGQKEKATNIVTPQVFEAKRSAEADSLEKMMLGDSGINISSTMGKLGAPEGNLVSEIDMPSFDPVATLKEKIAQKGTNQHQQQDFTPRTNQMSEMREMMQLMMEQQKPAYDLNLLKEMMEVIARKVAENTIKQVISEFVAENKKKNVYEVYNKEKSIVKIGDKLYKLTPVVIKSH